MEVGFKIQFVVMVWLVLGKVNGYQYVWIDVVSEFMSEVCSFIWLFGGCFYIYCFVSIVFLCVLIGESGVNDFVFNLCCELMLLQCVDGQVVIIFYGVLELYGRYDGIVEIVCGVNSCIDCIVYYCGKDVDVLVFDLVGGQCIVLGIVDELGKVGSYEVSGDGQCWCWEGGWKCFDIGIVIGKDSK